MQKLYHRVMGSLGAGWVGWFMPKDCAGYKHTPNNFKRAWYCLTDEWYCSRHY